jgi:hypothetical protein
LLSQSILANGLYNKGRFIVIHPEQNNKCDVAISRYRIHLIDGPASATGFDSVTLEKCLTILRDIGNKELADNLFQRYLDFEKVEQAIFG